MCFGGSDYVCLGRVFIRNAPDQTVKVDWKTSFQDAGFSDDEIISYEDILDTIGVTDFHDVEIIDNDTVYIIRGKIYDNNNLQLRMTLENRKLTYVKIDGISDEDEDSHINLEGDLSTSTAKSVTSVKMYSSVDGGCQAVLDWGTKTISPCQVERLPIASSEVEFEEGGSIWLFIYQEEDDTLTGSGTVFGGAEDAEEYAARVVGVMGVMKLMGIETYSIIGTWNDQILTVGFGDSAMKNFERIPGEVESVIKSVSEVTDSDARNEMPVINRTLEITQLLEQNMQWNNEK